MDGRSEHAAEGNEAFNSGSPDDAHVLLVASARISEAEKMIVSCEYCNAEAEAMVPFEWNLFYILNYPSNSSIHERVDCGVIAPDGLADYILEQPPKCPRCRREASVDTLVEPLWFKELLEMANEGDAEAQATLGTLYQCGLYITYDGAGANRIERIKSWHRERQLSDRRTHLLLENQETAEKWYRISAAQGNARGQLSLGIYLQAEESNFVEPLSWIHKAANQGNAFAMEWMGVMYEMYLQTPVLALMWYLLAISYPPCRETLPLASLLLWSGQELAERADRLAAKMTPSQRAEAKRLASEWVPK